MLFATPDFGASGAILLFVLCVWAVVLALSLAGVLWGRRLLRSGSFRVRAFGFSLVLVSGAVPVGCCLGPPYVVRLTYGNYPLGSYPNGKVREGMSREEVEAALGTPHERYRDEDGENWYYWIDSFGMGWFGVRFGADGHVLRTYGN